MKFRGSTMYRKLFSTCYMLHIYQFNLPRASVVPLGLIEVATSARSFWRAMRSDSEGCMET